MADSSPRVPVSRAARGQGSALAERAYGRIREAIASLVLQPGQSLTEASISEWLGIGRMPVREALLRLREEGLVESVPRRGYYVSRISPEEAQEIYEMLEGLEGSAAKLAAQRGRTRGHRPPGGGRPAAGEGPGGRRPGRVDRGRRRSPRNHLGDRGKPADPAGGPGVEGADQTDGHVHRAPQAGPGPLNSGPPAAVRSDPGGRLADGQGTSPGTVGPGGHGNGGDRPTLRRARGSAVGKPREYSKIGGWLPERQRFSGSFSIVLLLAGIALMRGAEKEWHDFRG